MYGLKGEASWTKGVTSCISSHHFWHEFVSTMATMFYLSNCFLFYFDTVAKRLPWCAEHFTAKPSQANVGSSFTCVIIVGKIILWFRLPFICLSWSKIIVGSKRAACTGSAPLTRKLQVPGIFYAPTGKSTLNFGLDLVAARCLQIYFGVENDRPRSDFR